MSRASELIEVRRKWVTTLEMSQALGIDRTTLWKRERQPAAAPVEFWQDYANALRSKISPQAQDALRALDLISQAACTTQVA
jgi:hypothetical protein